MGKGEDKRNAQGGVFTPAEESQPGKTSMRGSEQAAAKGREHTAAKGRKQTTAKGREQTAIGGKSPLRKLPYLLIPLWVRFPLLAKLLLLFLFSKWLKHAVGNVLMRFLYRKNEEVFQELIQLLLLQMRQGGGEKGRNKSNFKGVRQMVDAVYSSIQGMMKCITRVYFFPSGTPCSELFLPEDINEKSELISTPRRVSNLWVLRGAYLNLFVALLGQPEWQLSQPEQQLSQPERQINQRERQINQRERQIPYPAEQTLYKNIRDLYKVKYKREYQIMMRSECFSFLRFFELLQYIGKKVCSCLHLVLLTTMSIYCLCRSLFILKHHIHALEKKKLYERYCERRSASDELFRLLIESVAHMSENLAGQEAPICAEGSHPDGDNPGDNHQEDNQPGDNHQDDKDPDGDNPNDKQPNGDNTNGKQPNGNHPDGELHIYDALQTKLRLCLSIINRIKGEPPRDASKMVVNQNPRQAHEFPRHEEPVPTYEPPRQKEVHEREVHEREVYETEALSGHTGGETANGDPTSQRKEQQKDGTLTYAIYLYESRTGEEATQGNMKHQVGSTSLEDASKGHSSHERQSQREQKEEDRTEGNNHINGPMSSQIASWGNDNETKKRHIEERSSPHPSADLHGRKAPSNLSCEILINELKGTFRKKKRYVYLSKKLFFDVSVGDYVMRDVSSDGKGKSGGEGDSEDGGSNDGGSDDGGSDKGHTKRRGQVNAPGGAYPRRGENARENAEENAREEDCLRPMADVAAFRQNIAAAISHERIV